MDLLLRLGGGGRRIRARGSRVIKDNLSSTRWKELWGNILVVSEW